MLNKPEVQSNVLWENSLVIKEEARKGEVEGLRRRAEVRSVN